MKLDRLHLLDEAMNESLEKNPDMQLTCLYCGKMFKPYNHMVNHDFAFFGFCNTECFRKHHSWVGAVRRFFEDVICWLWHKPKYFIIDSYYNTKAPLCPECGVKLKHQCRFANSNLFWCENYDEDCWFHGEYK
ncbi:unnamed protein product, partial [marine sediment metagenome]